MYHTSDDNNTTAAVRFATLTEEDLAVLIDGKESKNTKVATKHAVKLFREYLDTKLVNSDFDNFSEDELNTRLKTFYAELRNKDGKVYKRTTLQSIRCGLRREVGTMLGTFR